MTFDGSETIPVPNKNEIRLEKSMTMIPNNYGLVFPICQFPIVSESISWAEGF